MTMRLLKLTPLLATGALALLLTMPAAAQAPADVPNSTPSTAPVSTAPETPAPAAPDPETKKSSRFRLGPEVGVLLLTSGKARSQFGNSSISLGLGLGSIARASTQGRLALDLQIQYQTRNGNHLFLAPLGIGYRKALNEGTSTVTYVGATADLDFVDIRSGDYDVHSGIRTAFGASPLIGVSFGDSGFLEARYLYVSRVKGFDLSGLNVSAGYRF